MGEAQTKPRRRWTRGGIFWLCIALSGLVAGRWIKSYWRVDWINFATPATVYIVGDHFGVIELAWFPDGLLPPQERLVSWKWDGFDTRDVLGVYHCVRIPHWFPLLFCLLGAWWASRPWRKGRRGGGRGFEVLAR